MKYLIIDDNNNVVELTDVLTPTDLSDGDTGYIRIINLDDATMYTKGGTYISIPERE